MEPVSEGERAGEWWAFSAHNSWEVLGFPASLQPPNSRLEAFFGKGCCHHFLLMVILWKGICHPGSFLRESACFPHFPLQGRHPGSTCQFIHYSKWSSRVESGTEIQYPHRNCRPKPNRLGKITDKSQSPEASGLPLPAGHSASCHPTFSISNIKAFWPGRSAAIQGEKMGIFLK